MQGIAARPAVARSSPMSAAAPTEAVEFTNGSRILFGARESGFGRGFAKVDVVCWMRRRFSPRALDDMLPATNAAPNGLVSPDGGNATEADRLARSSPRRVTRWRPRQAPISSAQPAGEPTVKTVGQANPATRPGQRRRNRTYAQNLPQVFQA